MIEYECDVCGYHGVIRYDHYKHGIGCSACNGKSVHKGFNDLATTDPHIAALCANPEDAFSVTRKSHRKIPFRCKDCGAVTVKPVADVTTRGLKCPSCSISMSFPNRVMKAVLDRTGIEYQREASFSWSAGKRYDFYIESISTIIEMNGRQHYDGFNGHKFYELSDIQANDKFKHDVAIENGIEHYIVIDASESSIEYISSNIMSSELPGMIDLSCIDWDDIATTIDMGIYWDVVLCYNASRFTGDIQKMTHLDADTIRRILRLAARNGDCDYSPEASLRETQAHAASCRKKRVICLTTGEVFESVNDACNRYGIKPKTLSASLNHHKTTSKKIGNAGIKLQWDYCKE